MVKNYALGKTPLLKVDFLTTISLKILRNGQKLHFRQDTATQSGNFDHIHTVNCVTLTNNQTFSNEIRDF